MLLHEEQSGRFLRRPKQDYPAAAEAEFCTAVLNLVRRVVAGPGATYPYNWEGMMVALIQRIHDRGVPVTQSELVTDMQDWFADQSNGAKITDGRTVRRRLTPVRKVLHREEA
jgi:hypothetical protein